MFSDCDLEGSDNNSNNGIYDRLKESVWWWNFWRLRGWDLESTDNNVNNSIDDGFKNYVDDNNRTVKWEDRINNILVDSWSIKDGLNNRFVAW